MVVGGVVRVEARSGYVNLCLYVFLSSVCSLKVNDANYLTGYRGKGKLIMLRILYYSLCRLYANLLVMFEIINVIEPFELVFYVLKPRGLVTYNREEPSTKCMALIYLSLIGTHSLLAYDKGVWDSWRNSGSMQPNQAKSKSGNPEESNIYNAGNAGVCSEPWWSGAGNPPFNPAMMRGSASDSSSLEQSVDGRSQSESGINDEDGDSTKQSPRTRYLQPG